LTKHVGRRTARCGDGELHNGFAQSFHMLGRFLQTNRE
jgi:hypothetical protein